MPSRSFDAEVCQHALEHPQAAESERREPPKRREEAAVVPGASELPASPGVLHVRSHRIGRHRQFGSHLLDAAPQGEKLEYPLLLLG